MSHAWFLRNSCPQHGRYKKKEHTSNCTRIEEKQKENRKQKVHLLQHAATTSKILPVAQYMYTAVHTSTYCLRSTPMHMRAYSESPSPLIFYKIVLYSQWRPSVTGKILDVLDVVWQKYRITKWHLRQTRGMQWKCTADLQQTRNLLQTRRMHCKFTAEIYVSGMENRKK